MQSRDGGRELLKKATLIALAVGLVPVAVRGQSPAVPDLSGRWVDAGRPVEIEQSGTSLVARFVEPPLCDPQDGSTPEPREIDFEGSIAAGDTIRGEARVCNYGESWGGQIGIQNVDMWLVPDASADVLTGEYKGWQGWAPMQLVRAVEEARVDDGCEGARRALMQAEGLLENYDARMQGIANRYDDLYDGLSEQSKEFESLRKAAGEEWRQFQIDQALRKYVDVLAAFLPFPPDQGSISASQSVLGFYEMYQANSGTIEEMRAWAEKNATDYDLDDLLSMLDHMDRMYETTGQMAQLRNEYDEMEVNRQPLMDNVEDARRRLEECMAVG